MLVSTSFLSSKNPPRDLKLLNETDTDYIHVDVMDGKFVSHKTMPFREMRNIYKYTSKRLDVHLMVLDPIKAIKKYARMNAEYITIHVEAHQVKESLLLIKSFEIKAGLALCPDTPVLDLIPYLPLVDQILIMSVKPGEGGQEFMKEVVDKVEEVKTLLKEYQIHPIVSIDGGINHHTVSYCQDCDMVVSGSYVILSDDFQERINCLR